MVGGFPRSTLYQILHCGFFAFVSIMVLFYISLFKSILKPGSITQLMSVGARTEAVFVPARRGYISQSLQETHGTLQLGYWGKF